MTQLFFKYGTMNAGKSLQLLATAHNYTEQGKQVLILTSSLDTRSGMGKVASRVGVEADAIALNRFSDVVDLVQSNVRCHGDIDCVLVDETQFLTMDQVVGFATLVDSYHIPVICFGLKIDFQGKLFEGARALLELADKIEEIKTVCQWCNKKATMNLRLVNGKPAYSGDQVQIGDQEYVSVCREHYFDPKL